MRARTRHRHRCRRAGRAPAQWPRRRISLSSLIATSTTSSVTATTSPVAGPSTCSVSLGAPSAVAMRLHIIGSSSTIASEGAAPGGALARRARSCQRAARMRRLVLSSCSGVCDPIVIVRSSLPDKPRRRHRGHHVQRIGIGIADGDLFQRHRVAFEAAAGRRSGEQRDRKPAATMRPAPGQRIVSLVFPIVYGRRPTAPGVNTGTAIMAIFRSSLMTLPCTRGFLIRVR